MASPSSSLLPRDQAVDDDDNDHDDMHVKALDSRYQPLWVRLACILLDFLTQTYDQIRIVPEIVLFERWLCRSHYPGQDYGMQCKSHEMQVELARLRSWKALFDGAASM